MATATQATSKFPITGWTVGGETYDEVMQRAKDLVVASETVMVVCFDSSFFRWKPLEADVPPTTFPEIIGIDIYLEPSIMIDYTLRGKLTADEDSIQGPIEKLRSWLSKNPCPKLRGIHVYWNETTDVVTKFFTGFVDGYDRYGPIEETDYDNCSEQLDGNIIVERYLPDLHIDWEWLPLTVTYLSLPSSLWARSRGREGLQTAVDVLEEYSDEHRFDSILDKY